MIALLIAVIINPSFVEKIIDRILPISLSSLELTEGAIGLRLFLPLTIILLLLTGILRGVLYVKQSLYKQDVKPFFE